MGLVLIRKRILTDVPSFRVSLVIIAAFLLTLRPIDDVDMYTWLRLGKEMLSHGLSAPEPILFQDVSRVSIGWLYHLLVAFLHSFLGLAGVRFLHVALVLGGFIFAANSLRKDRVSVAAQAFAFSLAFIVAGSNLNVRPQGMAIFCFGILQWLLGKATFGTKSAILFIPVALVWVNCHPSTVLGMLLCACSFAVRLRLSLGERDNRNTLLPPTVLGLILLVATFFTPDGARIFSISAQNTEIARNLLEVTEWLPPWRAEVRSAMMGFWCALTLSIPLLIRYRRSLSSELLFQGVVFALLALSAARFALFWALVMLPVWIAVLSSLPLFNRQLVPSQRNIYKLFPVFLLLLIILRGGGRESVIPGDMPVECIKALSRVLPEGRIYNYRELGGPAAFWGSQRWTLLVDGRLYLFPREFWIQHYREAAGEIELKQIAEQWQPEGFLLHPGFDSGLISRLENESSWQILFRDTECLAAARVAAARVAAAQVTAAQVR